MVEEQIQQILLYMQGGSADIQKENFLKDLKTGLLEYEIAREFLMDLKKKFGEEKEEEEETVKAVELKRLEQGEKMIKEFVQEFKRTVRENRYKGKLLIEEFKWRINNTIW